MSTIKTGSPAKTVAFSDASRQFIEASAEKRIAEQNWRRVAIASLLVTSLSIVGNIYQSQLPREIPYVVRESGDGSIAGGAVVRPAEMPDIPWQKYQISRWITETRSVSSDPHIQNTFQRNAAMLLLANSPAAATVASYYQSTSIHDRVGVKMNYVRPRPGEEHVWEADWTESVIDAKGSISQTEHWNAVIAVDFSRSNVVLPNGDDPDYANPYGMYIRDISWSREAN